MLVPQMYLSEEYLTQQGLSSTFPLRFIAKIAFTTEDGCWLWTGSTRPCGKNWPKGHGMIQRREGVNCKIYSHRAAWILWRGPIPESKQVNHICPGGPNPQCCNPKHLELGDQFSNMKKMTSDGHNHFSKHSFAGQKHALSKLTWNEVREIRSKRKTGTTLRLLSLEYGISIGQLSHICRNESWVEPGSGAKAGTH